MTVSMENESEFRPWERLLELVDSGDSKEIEAFLAEFAPSEVVRTILRLDLADQNRVLTTLSPEEAADLIDDLPDEQAADLIENLTATEAAAILNEMPSDEKADILGDLDQSDAEAILEAMKPDEANEARRLILYDDDVAGGLMVTEILRFPESTTAAEVIEGLGPLLEIDEDYFTQYAYVVSPWDRLIGVLETRDLVLARRSLPLADIMVPSPSIAESATLDELKAFFDRHGFLGAPVVDPHGRLLGVVTRDVVMDDITERIESEHLKMQGIVGGDEIRALPILTRTRRRLSWLSVNIVLNLVAASVIAFYLDTLEAVIALAVFLPIVSDMSGCSGNQAVAISLRELALGIVKPYEALRVWVQEISVGAINGLALGCLLGAVAWAWKGNPYLGLVVGGALAVNTLISVSIGGVVPLILKRVGVDPAVASGPILTTVTDMCGFFLLLAFATMLLSKLA